jgi:uncharacterized protein with ParB-like and HNH nuclease domain
MQADPTYLLKSLSNNDVTFFIPPYQRNYEWSMETCRVFLKDVQNTARDNREGRLSEHFFGSVVYVIEQAGFGLPDKFILTDGQQRITTSMLFLMALRDSVTDTDLKKQIQSRYLENERAGENTEFKIKLKQVETDWESYKLLALSLEVPKEFTNSSVFQNYQFFKNQLSTIEEEEKRSLLELGLSKFSIISIQLEPDRNHWENPQEIFESMNSLGKPLSLADLVRNYLLMGKDSAEQERLYRSFWMVLEKQLPGLLSEFIRDWMQADRNESVKVASENNFKELYGEFKKLSADRDAEELFTNFVDFSTAYSIASGLSDTPNKRINELLFDLQVIGIGPARSFIAQIIQQWRIEKADDNATVSILRALRTYLLRRRILGLSNAENKLFPSFGKRVNQIIESPNSEQAMFDALSSSLYATRLPNDDEVKAGLERMNFYNWGRSRSYPRLLLALIEQSLTKSRPAWDDSTLQLEHIMPQTLNDEWRSKLGDGFESVHQEWLHNIGNLALIRHNQELGNAAFEDKKIVYRENSGLQVTQLHVLDREVWDEKSILRRRDKMVDLLINDVLVLPDNRKRASNWHQESRNDAFDIRQIMNQLIGQNIHFTSDHRIVATVLSDSLVSFEGKEWSISGLTKELKKREGDISPKSQFQGANYWMWGDTRLADLDI